MPARSRSTPFSVLVQLAADGGIAAAAYLMASRVRLPDAAAVPALDESGRALALTVICQIIFLALAGVYSSPFRRLWPRLLLGASLGTATAAVATAWTSEADLSLASFALDALLLACCVFSWRGAFIVGTLAARRRIAETDGHLMDDRADRSDRAGHALFGLVTYRQLLKNLLLRDLKLKYRGSTFGFAWSLLNPLLMLVVYTLAFTYVMRIAEPGFAFRVLIGLLAWGFFANSLNMATGAVVDNRGLIKSVFFPRTILPTATVLFNLAQFLLNIVVFVPLMLVVFSVTPAAPMAVFPIVLALHIAFTIGLALVLATATAFFRDVRHLLEVALNVLFWTTPIIYSYQQIPASIRTAVLFSPLSPFVVGYQQIFFFGEWPDLFTWVLASMYAAASLISGFMLFSAFEHRFAEQV
jgi:ABC-type polysaccharide/polyol phosphate export permease